MMTRTVRTVALLGHIRRALFAFLLLCSAGCYDSSHNDKVRLYTEAEHASVDGVWPITISIDDSKSNLAELRPLPKTAYLWNESMSCRLALEGMSYRLAGDNATTINATLKPYKPDDGKVTQIHFSFTPEGLKPEQFPPRPPGIYNISVQLNGSAGIHTVCGSFSFVSEHRMISFRPGNWH
jgi:hypothetical protein